MTGVYLLAAKQVPKSNGFLLIALALFVLATSAALYVQSRRPSSTTRQRRYNNALRWSWGYGMGIMGLGILGEGIYLAMTGH